MSLNIGFFGSADFVVPFLERVNPYNAIKFIVTSPDKPKGRGMKLTPPDVKIFGINNNIPVYQPQNIKDKNFIEEINNYKCDINLVIAYGKILPRDLLFYPRLGSINLHFSLLPRWRGAAPINWAILSGDKITGITIMKMDEGLDTGDIIFQKEIIIEEEDTSIDLLNKMIAEGKDFLLDSIKSIEEGNYKLTKQDDRLSTYARILKKEDGLINWEDSAININNKVRGLLPWPQAFTFIEDKRVVLIKTKVLEGASKKGYIKEFDGEGIIVGTGDGLIKIIELKEEGKRVLSAKDYYNGRKDIIGSYFQS